MPTGVHRLFFLTGILFFVCCHNPRLMPTAIFSPAHPQPTRLTIADFQTKRIGPFYEGMLLQDAITFCVRQRPLAKQNIDIQNTRNNYIKDCILEVDGKLRHVQLHMCKQGKLTKVLIVADSNSTDSSTWQAHVNELLELMQQKRCASMKISFQESIKTLLSIETATTFRKPPKPLCSIP